MKGLFERFEFACRTTVVAGKRLARIEKSGFDVGFKKRKRDIVTTADLEVEKLIADAITAKFPNDVILGEEQVKPDRLTTEIKQGPVWHVDPLDGSVNFAHHFPFYSVSIGFSVEDTVRFGAVYCPRLDELYTAFEGRGARLNGKPISVSNSRDFSRAFIVTGFPYNRRGLLGNIQYFREISKRVQAVRRVGSAALDLCYVGRGVFDGFWEFDLKPWDIAAGALIAKEAGAVLLDFDGKPLKTNFEMLTKGQIIAGNRFIAKRISKIIQQTGKHHSFEGSEHRNLHKSTVRFLNRH